MRRLTYAQAAAGASSSSSSELQQQQQQQQRQRQTSTDTTPSLCSASLSREDDFRSKSGISPTATRPPRQPKPPPAPVPVGINPGTVKLLTEQFERQSSENSLSSVPPLRPATAAAAVAAAAAAALEASEAASVVDSGSTGDVQKWDPLTDSQTCAEVIQQLLHEKQQLQQQVESLWSQKEAFRCANERISKVLLRQQQQERAAEHAAAAEAAGATPREGLSRRRVTLIPSGSLTTGGPMGPRVGLGPPAPLPATQAAGYSAPEEQGRQLLLHHPGQQHQPPQQQQQQQQQQQWKAAARSGVSPLNLGALQHRLAEPPQGSITAAASPLAPATSISLQPFRGSGAATCRASLASTALKTPRRRFDDGGISARSSAKGLRRGESHGLEQQQHAAIEEALVASMRSMNMLGTLGLGGVSRKGSKSAATGTGATWEPTPEAALIRCSSTPERGFWHSTFLCALKVEGTDFFLDAVQQQPLQPRPQRRGGSNFLLSGSDYSSSVTGDAGGFFMSNARIVASKDTAGVFQVCVRHLLNEDHWLRSVWTSVYWGLPSGVDPSILPPDQSQEHGLSRIDTQAASLKDTRLSSSASESEKDETEDGSPKDGSDGTWSGWDAVAFMYQRSIDSTGAPVPGKSASACAGLYISTRPQAAGANGGPSRRSNSSGKNSNSNSSSNNGSSNSSSSGVDSRRAEPYSSANQLILQGGQAAEQLFTVRAKDRHTGVMPLFHQVTQKYLHVHPTMGLVGLVPPVAEQEAQLRLQKKAEQQLSKRARKRMKAKKHHEQPQRQGSSSSTGSNTTSNSPHDELGLISPDLLLKPCRIEMIPLADLLLQQSVQRVLTSVQEAALQQQQEELQRRVALEASMVVSPAGAVKGGASSTESVSDADDSFEGVVPSEGGEEVVLSTGITSRRPLVPPLTLSAETTAPGDAAAAAGHPVLLRVQLDDEGVETDVEEQRLTPNSSSSSSSKNVSRGATQGNGQPFFWPTSLDSCKGLSSSADSTEFRQKA